MHIITRQVNESLIVGNIHVTVLEIHDDHVRLAFSSPDENPAYWEEILYLEQTEAAQELQMQ